MKTYLIEMKITLNLKANSSEDAQEKALEVIEDLNPDEYEFCSCEEIPPTED